MKKLPNQEIEGAATTEVAKIQSNSHEIGPFFPEYIINII